MARVTVPVRGFREALDALKFIPSRSSNPSLSHVVMVLADNTLRLRASDLEISAELTIKADVEGEHGHHAVPYSVLRQVISALPGELCELGFDEIEVTIASGGFKTTLQLAFMTLPENDEAHYPATLPGSTLKSALERVAHAVAVAEYQAIFRGVNFKFEETRTRIVGTDGFRLALVDVEAVPLLAGTSFTLPRRLAESLSSWLGDTEVRFEVKEGKLLLAFDTFKVSLSLLEGTYPAYSRVIPKTFLAEFSVNAEKVTKCLERVVLLADKSANNRVDLLLKNSVLHFSSQGGYGTAKESLEVEWGKELALSYNANYFLNALKPISKDVKVQLSGTTSPSIFSDVADTAYMAMVVPLRVD